jgi:hypothetical protein
VTPQERREREAAKLAEHIKALVDSAPPFGPEQRARLAALLRPADTEAVTGGGRVA